MKSVAHTIKRLVAGFVFALSLAFTLHARQLPTDLMPVAAADIPSSVCDYRSIQMSWPPLPFNWLSDSNVQLYVSPSFGATVIFVGDQNIDYLQLDAQAQVLRLAGRAANDEPPAPPGGDDGGGGGVYPPSYDGCGYDTNGLYLEITNVVAGLAYLNLHHPTNLVYSIWSTTNLPAGWQVETEVWPTNQDVMPFTVPTLDRPNLFLRAEDWTGVTENGNTTPDWWFWEYFGTVNLSDANLDSQGNTLLYDYTNGFDPNVISFSLWVTNEFVNTDTAPLQISLSAGMPNYYALLVNDTNGADANWQPYAGPTLMASLGSADGVYNVLVGLRGSLDATQTWQSVKFIRDTAPLLLTLTNLGVYSGSRPFIDPAGYANKALSRLAFQVINANGTTNSADGVVIDHTVNPTNMLQTINWFECVDLPLAIGTNNISIAATDLAGNTAVLSFNYLFDTNGDVTPPVTALIWPQDGMEISGTNLTLRGTLDDDTATVTAQFVDASGATNLINGLVERGGEFWLENVPLSPGTNLVVLTATDAAGNTSTTNLTLVQSSLTLTMNPVSSDQLNYVTVNVSGAISDPSCAVWVNGVQGVNNGDYTWTANNVPVTAGGTASFDITAYPPGYAPTDNSWTNYSIQQLAYPNPMAAAQVQANSNADKQPVVYMQSSAWGYHYVQTNDSVVFTHDETLLWARQAGGSYTITDNTQDLTTPAASGKRVDTVTWPPDSGCLPSLAGWEEVDYYDADGALYYSSTGAAAAPAPEVEHGEVNGAPDICYGFPYNLTAENVIMLFTGKAVRGKQALFVMSAGLSDEIVNLCATEPFLPFTTPVPSPAITLETFGQLDADGLAYKLLAYGQTLPVTPHTDGQLYGQNGVPGQNNYQLISQTLCSVPTNTARLTIGIGEQVVCYIAPFHNATWTLIGDGSLSGTNGPSTTLTASLSPGNSTVVARIGPVAQQLAFTVVAPSGIGNVTVYTNLGLGATGTNGIGALTKFSLQIFPTNVSFANVQFREDIPAFIITWPNSMYTTVNARIVPMGAGGDCLRVVTVDTIQDGPWPIYLLYSGTNAVDCPVYVTWQDQYLNASSNWVDFATLQTITTYRGSDQKCRQRYQGVPGDWQGPWATSQPQP